MTGHSTLPRSNNVTALGPLWEFQSSSFNIGSYCDNVTVSNTHRLCKANQQLHYLCKVSTADALRNQFSVLDGLHKFRIILKNDVSRKMWQENEPLRQFCVNRTTFNIFCVNYFIFYFTLINIGRTGFQLSLKTINLCFAYPISFKGIKAVK